MITPIRLLTTVVVAAGATLALSAQDPAQPPPRQPNEIVLTILGPSGLPPKYAVPDFVALTDDTETLAAAKTDSVPAAPAPSASQALPRRRE